MKKILPLLLLLITYECKAQDYKTGIGFRGGWTSGITAKHFIKEGRAMEGIFSSGWGWRGFQITGLYEIHKAAFTKDDIKGLFWFYGGGAHFGGGYGYDYWHQTGPYSWNGYYERRHYSTLGIDGIFGIEYRIPDLPVTIALDVKPFFEFSGYRNYPFHFWDSAFTIRYVF
ncbi:MAG: hypothetical protein HY840_03345 [Bacteroidetes bacterium]|nr:hypothetical protein [Bacteroidota bacterium]